jgi:hypothetical protein
VNSLWFLSLVINLSSALLATSLQQWARRYIRLTQPARRTPEKRARIRAFYANGVDKMHIPWAVEGLPTLLHLSLFLFFGGLAIFLFNVDQEVFTWVVCWIGLFLMVYGLITLLPLIRHESPYYSPLSKPAWVLYAGIHYVTSKALVSITSYRWLSSRQVYKGFLDSKVRYHGWMLGGLEKKAEEMASERSPEIDIQILGWTISALGDDDSLEKFFEAIPGLFNSKMVENILIKYWDQVPKTVEMGYTLARWCASENQRTAQYAQCIVNWVLATLPERDDRWVELAARIFGLPEREIRDIIVTGDDSVSLAILIQVTRNLHTFRSDSLRDVLARFSKVDFFKVDILNTLPRLQQDFCTLWNELVQEARRHTIPVYILREIRHLYIALHQGTDASPTLFSNFTNIDITLFVPSSYPLCNIASHRTDSAAHVPAPNSPAVLRQVNEASNIQGPHPSSDPTTLSEIGDSSQALAVTSPSLPVHISSRPTDASLLPGVVAAPTPTLAPTPASTTWPVPSELTASCEAGAITTSNPLLPSPSLVGLPNPVSPPPPSYISPSPNLEFTLPRLRARGLVNTRSMCFANAVLQLLVHSPPFWNLFRELGDLKGKRGEGGPDIGGSATPLVDAMVRFF